MTVPTPSSGSPEPTPCPVCASAGRPMFPLHTWSNAAAAAPTTGHTGHTSRTGPHGTSTAAEAGMDAP